MSDLVLSRLNDLRNDVQCYARENYKRPLDKISDKQWEILLCEWAGLRCGYIAGDDATDAQTLNEALVLARDINVLLNSERRPGRQHQIRRKAAHLLILLAQHAESRTKKGKKP